MHCLCYYDYWMRAVKPEMCQELQFSRPTEAWYWWWWCEKGSSCLDWSESSKWPHRVDEEMQSKRLSRSGGRSAHSRVTEAESAKILKKIIQLSKKYIFPYTVLTHKKVNLCLPVLQVNPSLIPETCCVDDHSVIEPTQWSSLMAGGVTQQCSPGFDF